MNDIDFTNNECIIDNNLDIIDILNIFDRIISFEKTDKDKNIKIHLKKLETSKLIEIFKYMFKNILEIRNISMLLNIINIAKTYNTFDDSFFENEDVFIDSIEQFLDVKLDLEDQITAFNQNLVEVFLSICRSSNKMEYSLLDDYEDLPLCYNIIFNSIDIMTICGIISTLDGKQTFNLKKYKNSFQIIDSIFSQYAIANKMITSILAKIK